MQVPYQKMHGTGNQILIIDQRIPDSRGAALLPPSERKLREFGNKNTGPGFDQLMWVSAADDDKSVAEYRVFNADGSEVEQCGNGVRCVARYLFDAAQELPNEFRLQSPAGPVTVRISDDTLVAVTMGAPVFEPREIPFDAPEIADSYELETGDTKTQIAALSMGNPHAVIEVSDVRSANVIELGPLIEHHPRFPEKANVGFMHIVDRANIDLRVHERGVGETAACGTGACAAVVTGQRRGALDDEVVVRLPGGQVVVSWRGGGSPVWLKGNAELIDEGTLDL